MTNNQEIGTVKLEAAKGHWALVTGASSGIGREFALQLGAAGLNLVLVARRKHMVDALGKELSRRYGVQALAIPVDLCQDSSIAAIKSRLMTERITVRMIVNNAALACWGNFEATPLETYEQIIKLNVLAPVAMTHCFIQDLNSFPTSAIINISSPAALNPMPYMAVYAATKAFVFNFSQALYGEWKERGVLVQTLLPGPTETELGVAAANFSSAFRERESVETVVKASLFHLTKGAPLVVTAKGTFKQRLFAALFPAKFVIKTVARMFQPPGEKKV